ADERPVEDDDEVRMVTAQEQGVEVEARVHVRDQGGALRVAGPREGRVGEGAGPPDRGLGAVVPRAARHGSKVRRPPRTWMMCPRPDAPAEVGGRPRPALEAWRRTGAEVGRDVG